MYTGPDNSQVRPDQIDEYLHEVVKPFLDSVTGSTICGISDILEVLRIAFSLTYDPFYDVVEVAIQRFKTLLDAQGGFTSTVKAAVDKAISDLKLLFNRVYAAINRFNAMPSTTDEEKTAKLLLVYNTEAVLYKVSSQPEPCFRYSFGEH